MEEKLIKQDTQEVCDKCCDAGISTIIMGNIAGINNEYIGSVFQWLINNDYIICKKSTKDQEESLKH